MTSPSPIPGLNSMNLSTVDDQGHSVLYKGEPGTGKTYNVLTWPQPIVLAYFDKNQLTVREALKAGIDVQPVYCESWSDFADKFVPYVSTRQAEARTIAVDSWDNLSNMMWAEIQGTKARLAIQDFGTGLSRMVNAMATLTETTMNTGDGQRYYNFLATVHIRAVGADDGGIDKYMPAVMGQFRDVMASYFDWELLCEGKLKGTIVDGKNVNSKKYFVHTIPPNPRHTCKGGGLPAQCPGTYPELMELSGQKVLEVASPADTSEKTLDTGGESN